MERKEEHVFAWVLSSETPQAVEIADGDAAVFHGQVAGELQHFQRTIHPLTEDAGKVTDLFLRDSKLPAEAWVEHGVEQGG